MGRTKGSFGGVAVTAVSLCLLACAALVCSCKHERSVPPAQTAPDPDLEGERDGAIGRFFGPDNGYTSQKLGEAETQPAVRQALSHYAIQGYRYAPERSLVVAGTSGDASLEVTLICMSNAADESKDVVYVACIESDAGCGVAPARFSFDPGCGESGAAPVAPGVWLEMLPAPGDADPNSSGAGSIDRLSERFSWSEWWTCIAALAAASAGACIVSCLPSVPQGYMVCYFTCVGGAVIAATIKCTIQELFGS